MLLSAMPCRYKVVQQHRVTNSLIFETGDNRTVDLHQSCQGGVETVYVCGINMEERSSNSDKHGWSAFLKAIIDGVPTDKRTDPATNATNATTFSEHVWAVMQQKASNTDRGMALQHFLSVYGNTEHVHVARVLIFLLGRYATTLPALKRDPLHGNCSHMKLQLALKSLLDMVGSDFRTFCTAVQEHGNVLAATSLRWLICAATQAHVDHHLWTWLVIPVFRMTCVGAGGSTVAQTWIDGLRDATGRHGCTDQRTVEEEAEQRTVEEEAKSWPGSFNSGFRGCSQEAVTSLFNFLLEGCVCTPSQVLVVYLGAQTGGALSRPDKLCPPRRVAHSLHSLMFVENKEYRQRDPDPVKPPKGSVVESWFKCIAAIPDPARHQIGEPLVLWMKKASRAYSWPAPGTAIHDMKGALPDLFEALPWLEEFATHKMADMRGLFLPQLREVLMQKNPNPKTTEKVRVCCCCRPRKAHNAVSVQKLRTLCAKWLRAEIATVRNCPNCIPLLVKLFESLAEAIYPKCKRLRSGKLWHPTMASAAHKILNSLVRVCAEVATDACDEIRDVGPTLQSLAIASKTGDQFHDATHEMCQKFLQLFLEQHVTTTKQCLAAFNYLAEGNPARPHRQNALLSIAISHTAALVFEAPGWTLDLDTIERGGGAAERKMNEPPANGSVQREDADRTVTVVRLLTDYMIWSRFLKTCTHQGPVGDLSLSQCKPLVTAFKLAKHLATAVEGLNVTLRDVAELKKRWLAVKTLCKPIHGEVDISVLAPVTRWWQNWTQLHTFLADWCIRAKASDVDAQVCGV